MHEGYNPNPNDEAIHQRAERGEITPEEAIAIFRECALEQERKALAPLMIIRANLGRPVRGLATQGFVVTDNGKNCD
jgi:hypothetical protein